MTPWAIISPARLAGSGLLRTQSDARLVDLVRAGNDRAFEAIVHRYHSPLLRHCRRLLPAGRAEDAVQQAFLRALEAIRADGRELQLGAWLHRIAHNAAIDALRRLDSQWEQLDEQFDGVEPPDAALERRARFRSVVAGLGALPERQRRALVLRELEGRSYEEIAATLDVTGAGVRQLLNRARNAMRAGASAIVPPALVGRLAGSPAGVRVAELADGPGASTLLAKGAAVVAAGAVALFAATGTPGERPHAHAAAGSAGPQTLADTGDGSAGDARERIEPPPSAAGERRGRAGASGRGPARLNGPIDAPAARRDRRPSSETLDADGRSTRENGSAVSGGGRDDDDPPVGWAHGDPAATRPDDGDDDGDDRGEPDDDADGDEATDEGDAAVGHDEPDEPPESDETQVAPSVPAGGDAHSVGDAYEGAALSVAAPERGEDDDSAG